MVLYAASRVPGILPQTVHSSSMGRVYFRDPAAVPVFVMP